MCVNQKHSRASEWAGSLRWLGAALFIMIVILAGTMVNVSRVEAKDEDGDLVILLDAGHGGIDGGAAHNDVVEQVCNYAIALSLKAELETYGGVKVYLTRGSSEWFSNSGRGMMGENLNADLCISCHINSNEKTEPRGVECYITKLEAYNSSLKRLASLVCEKVSSVGVIRRPYDCYARIDEVSGNDYYTLIDEACRKAHIPAMIIEHAFVSNPQDAEFLKNPNNLVKLGIADATAIAQYYGLQRRMIEADQSITLIRTYSAMISGMPEGSIYTSSDVNIAYVREDGLITAVAPGTASITCTAADGTTKSVEVTVPAVELKAIAAGINPTFYADETALNNYKRDQVMVHGLYTDGSAHRVSAEQGSVVKLDDENYYVPVTYAGKSCKLHIYVDPRLATKGGGGTSATVGTNSEILRYPIVIAGLNGTADTTGWEIPTEAPTQPPTQAPTQAPTEPVTEEPATPEPTTEEPATTEPVTTENVTEEPTTIRETAPETAAPSQEMTTAPHIEPSSGSNIWMYFVLGGLVVMFAAVVVFLILHAKGRLRK